MKYCIYCEGELKLEEFTPNINTHRMYVCNQCQEDFDKADPQLEGDDMYNEMKENELY